MALEAVLLQQELFGLNTKDLYNLLELNFGVLEKSENIVSSNFLGNQTENFLSSPPYDSMVLPDLNQLGGPNSNPEAKNIGNAEIQQQMQELGASPPTISKPRKRRRSKNKKNEEEIENQRKIHIAVERNRRRQMNDYLYLLRSLMPPSFIARGDQASIIGGAINYVKELEQYLQAMSSHKHINQNSQNGSSLPFDEFFIFPQYSTNPIRCESSEAINDPMAENQYYGTSDIEVTMVDSHASLRIRLMRRPKQLLKTLSGLQKLRLTVLHLNVTTVDKIALYSLSVKVEDDCNLTSVDEIATAINQLLIGIQEEAIAC